MAQSLIQIFWQWRAKEHRLPRHRVDEAQLACVQGLPPQAAGSGAAIEFISEQRMSDRGHVNPYLMRSPGVQGTAHQTTQLAILQKFNVCFSQFAGMPGDIDHSHPQPIARVSSDRLINLTPGRTDPGTMRQRQILSPDLPRGDGPNQGVHCRSRARHHHQPARVLVQSVNNSGARQIYGPRIVGQQAVQKGTAPVTRCRMNHQARRFVEHQQMFILVHVVQGHELGLESLALRCRTQFDSRLVCGLDTR